MKKGINVTVENYLLSWEKLEKASDVLRSVNHGLRAKIIMILFKEGEVNVTDIYIKLRVEQSVASQHLAILREAGVVRTMRQGKNIFYSLDQKRLQQINGILHDLVGE